MKNLPSKTFVRPTSRGYFYSIFVVFILSACVSLLLCRYIFVVFSQVFSLTSTISFQDRNSMGNDFPKRLTNKVVNLPPTNVANSTKSSKMKTTTESCRRWGMRQNLGELQCGPARTLQVDVKRVCKWLLQRKCNQHNNNNIKKLEVLVCPTTVCTSWIG